jgi:hypothetical protein
MNADLRKKIVAMCKLINKTGKPGIKKGDIDVLVAEIKTSSLITPDDIALVERFYALACGALSSDQIPEKSNSSSSVNDDQSVRYNTSVNEPKDAKKGFLDISIDKQISELKKSSNQLFALCDKNSIDEECSQSNFVKRAKAIQACFSFIYRFVAVLPWAGNDLDRNELYSHLSAVFEIMEDYGWETLNQNKVTHFQRFIATFENNEQPHVTPFTDIGSHVIAIHQLIDALHLAKNCHGHAYVKVVKHDDTHNPDNILADLVIAIKVNDKSQVRDIITKNHLIIHRYFESAYLPNEISFTPLMIAAKYAVDAEMINTIMFGLSSKEKILLMKIVARSQSRFTAYENWNSMMVAAKWAHSSVFKALFLLLPPSKRGEVANKSFQHGQYFGFTLLVLACMHGNSNPASCNDAMDKIQFLLANGAVVNADTQNLIADVALPQSAFSSAQKTQILASLVVESNVFHEMKSEIKESTVSPAAMPSQVTASSSTCASASASMCDLPLANANPAPPIDKRSYATSSGQSLGFLSNKRAKTKRIHEVKDKSAILRSGPK